MDSEPATPEARLKALRERLYKTASKAAVALRIPKGTYLGLENGTRSITADRAKELATAFKTTPEYILYGRREALMTAPEYQLPGKGQIYAGTGSYRESPNPNLDGIDAEVPSVDDLVEKKLKADEARFRAEEEELKAKLEKVGLRRLKITEALRAYRQSQL